MAVVIAISGAALTGCGPARGHHHNKSPRQERPHKPHKPHHHKRPPRAAHGYVAEALVTEARNWIGTPYVWGGTSYDGADCSGFLQTLYKEVAGVDLPRTTRQQIEYCIPVDDDQRAVGDIMFFASKKSGGKVAHVGMYSGNGHMIHASSSRGVVEDDLTMAYYKIYYLGTGRVPLLADANPVIRKEKRKDPLPPPPVKAAEITLDEFAQLSTAPQPEPQTEPQTEPLTEPLTAQLAEPLTAQLAEPQPVPQSEARAEAKAQPEPEPQPEARAEADLQPEQKEAESPTSRVKNAFNRKNATGKE